MANPPTDIEPSELFLKLLERPAPSDVFPFPRMGDDGEPVFNVRVFVLPEKKIEACRMRARRWLAEQTKDAGGAPGFDEHATGDRVAKELLAEAVHEDRCVGENNSGKVYRRLFRNAADVAELSADEISSLFGAYLLTQVKFGPTDETFTDAAAVNAWVGRLAEGARPFALSLLASHQRDALLLCLVDRVSTISRLLLSPPESWPESLESIRSTWQVGIDSSSLPAAEPIPSPAEPEPLITPERAMEMARALREKSRL